MSQVQHTPGPWHVCSAKEAEHDWVIAQEEGTSVASSEPMGPWMSAAEASANAHLIAASPRMLSALRFALADVQGYLDNEWDGNIDGWRATASNLFAAIKDTGQEVQW